MREFEAKCFDNITDCLIKQGFTPKPRYAITDINNANETHIFTYDNLLTGESRVTSVMSIRLADKTIFRVTCSDHGYVYSRYDVTARA